MRVMWETDQDIFFHVEDVAVVTSTQDEIMLEAATYDYLTVHVKETDFNNPAFTCSQMSIPKRSMKEDTFKVRM